MLISYFSYNCSLKLYSSITNALHKKHPLEDNGGFRESILSGISLTTFAVKDKLFIHKNWNTDYNIKITRSTAKKWLAFSLT